MDQGALEHWEAFFQAQVGASAALAGLIFVSVSISLKQVLSAPRLSDRAFQALMVLVKILIISSLMLAPQPMIVIGVEVLFVGLLVWAMVLSSMSETCGPPKPPTCDACGGACS